jgi:cytochrome P450
VSESSVTMSVSYPPGPKVNSALLFAGRFVPALRDPDFEMMTFMRNAVQTYGEVVYWTMWPYRVYLLENPEHIHQVLVKQARSFHKSPFYRSILGKFLGNGLLVSDGEYWQRQRRLTQPAFHTSRISAYADTMVEYTQRTLAAWHDGQEIQVDHEMMQLTLAIVAKTLFDADVSGDSDEVRAAMEILQEVSVEDAQSIFALPEWLPTAHNRQRKVAIETLDRIILNFIQERRASGQDTGDLLSMLLATEEDGQGMTDAQVRDEAMTLFLAGHETTANALNWTWYLLAQYPEVEAKLHAEVDAVLGGRAATLADLKRLPYTAQVIKESMRLYPPAWNVARQAIEDVEIGGYTIETGSLVFVPIFLVQRDPRWYDDPDEFRPERWTEKFEQNLPRFAYLPFGGGPRVCIGNSFAQMEANLLLATIAGQYRLRLIEPDQQVGTDPLITLRPHGGMRLRLEARHPAEVQADDPVAIPAG